jgi:uncharacterized protein
MTHRFMSPDADDAPSLPAMRPLPPVELWNPPICNDIGMRIDAAGVWFYRDSPILRPELTRLFSTILRRDPDGYVLVTPVEKVRVTVEDAPFIAVELRRDVGPAGAILSFRTNVGDWTSADAERPLRFERGPHDGVKPYVRVRGDLWALVARALLMDLMDDIEEREIDGRKLYGVVSSGVFFLIGRAEDTGSRA